MAMNDAPTGAITDEDKMSAGPDMNQPPQAHDDKEEPISVFLPKAALMGRQVKAGDSLTLEVCDVDPETGDVEAKCNYEQKEGSGERMGYAEAFDKAMPEEE